MTKPSHSTDDHAQRSVQIQQVIDVCIDRRAAGEEVCDKSLIAAHPDLMPDLADALRNLRLVDQAQQQVCQREASGLHIRCPHCQNPMEVVDESSLSEIVCPSCGSQFSLTDDSDRTFQAAKQEKVNHFQLLDRVGVGAFGSVWSARDTQLDRMVALKIPRKGQLSQEDTEQFIREARAAAQLKHPNIVSVLEVGRYKDRIYIACDFIQGLDLADWLTDQQATPREAAELCATLADALQHAHDHGVIHRDLKPSNVMLDIAGDPHLMDFGLAKRESGEMTMTVEGKLLGTPAYMSPEQARGAAHDADARSDVYSLGVILFELLTGERPFRGSTRMLLHQILLEDASSPRKLNAQIPRDLETICLKCLEKSPSHRYQTAADLRDDLQHFLRGEPVQARPITKVARAWRWCKRKPVVAGLGATVALLLLILGIASPIIAFKKSELLETQKELTRQHRTARNDADQARDLANRARDQAQKLKEDLRRQLYASDMGMAQQALKRAQVAYVIERLDRHRPRGDEEDLRGFGWYYLAAVCRDVMMSPSIGGYHLDAMFSPDGQTMSVAGSLGLITRRDVNTFDVQSTYNVNCEGRDARRSAQSRLSPDGREIAVTLAKGRIRLVDLMSGEENLLDGPEVHLRSLAYSPDGNLLASGNDHGSVFVWNLTTRQLLIEVGAQSDQTAHDLMVTGVAFSPDSKTLATCSRDQTAKLWEIESGRLLATFDVRDFTSLRSSVWSIAFSPDGKTLATGTSGDNVVLLWEIGSDRLLHRFVGHDKFVTQLAFSDDGSLLASCGRTVRLWDVKDRKMVGFFPSDFQYDVVPFLTFSPDGTMLAVPCADDVKIWNRAPNPTILTLPDDWWRSSFGIALDGSRAVFGTRTKDAEGTVEVWDLRTGARIHQVSHGSSIILSAAWDHYGNQRFASIDLDGVVKVWNADTGALIRTFEIELDDYKYTRAWFSAHDNNLLVSSKNGRVSSWDLGVANPQEKVIHAPEPDYDPKIGRGDRFSHDQRWLATTGCAPGEDGSEEIRLWDVATDQLIRTYPGGDWVEFSWDDTLLAVPEGRDVRVLDRASGIEQCRLTGHDVVSSMRFSPDGKRLFCGGRRTVKIWNLGTGTLEFELDAHEASVRGIFITPDARTLTTVSSDKQIKQWRFSTDDELLELFESLEQKTDADQP